MIIRGIYCVKEQKNFKKKIHAISIVDEYLEHARVMYFYNKGSEDIYISSADWMTRNLDYRIEAAVKINHKTLKKELKDLDAFTIKAESNGFVQLETVPGISDQPAKIIGWAKLTDFRFQDLRNCN